MDVTKCYRKKTSEEYLGKFVETDDYYPDGPERGGYTKHTFAGLNGNVVVYGKYNDISDYEVVECQSKVEGGRRSNKRTRRNNLRARRASRRNNRTRK